MKYLYCCSLNSSSAFSSLASSFDSFPRLDPPPPSGKKRLPRALKTTQDMMISSDPVVSSPDPADSPGFPPSPDKVPLICEEDKEQEDGDEQENGAEREDEKNKVAPEDGGKNVTATDPEATGRNGEKERDAEERRSGSSGEEEEEKEKEEKQPVQLSVPDLIDKEADPRTKSCDVWLKVSDSRLASTPRSGKTPLCRISLGDDVLLPGNGGAPYSPEELERHPDLLSFE